MSRTIEKTRYLPDKPYDVTDPVGELNKKAETGRFAYLLAHADDGVIWGAIKDGQLALSNKAFPEISPELRPKTLWEARLFGEKAEWFLWRAVNGWRAREIRDGEGEEREYYDESLILWGTDPDGEAKGGFYPVREADLGIRHTPPLPLKKRHSLRLKVRHYVDYDPSGVAFVKLSRLVNLSNGGEK